MKYALIKMLVYWKTVIIDMFENLSNMIYNDLRFGENKN